MCAVVYALRCNTFLKDNFNLQSSSPLSSNHVDNGVFSYPLSPSVPIVHCFCQVLKTASSVCTELIHVSPNCLTSPGRPCVRIPKGTSLYEFVLTSPAVPQMSCLSYLNCLRDGR